MERGSKSSGKGVFVNGNYYAGAWQKGNATWKRRFIYSIVLSANDNNVMRASGKKERCTVIGCIIDRDGELFEGQ